MQAHIVIGANFGDEGKGQTVDYLCRRTRNNIVVRHNGGAQAAHTVVTEEGVRHVFHHFGSGTLAGSPTFLSKHFIVNPRAFIEESLDLGRDLDFGHNPKVFGHREALLTTPLDWILNWRLEEQRGNSRHGSCGMGINETVERCQNERYRTTLNDIFNIDDLINKLAIIGSEYVKERVKKLGVPWHMFADELSTSAIEPFIEDCKEMSKMIVPLSNNKILKTYRHVIFEGAQGLLLDEHHHYFPYVTRSKTGVTNAVQILKEIEATSADVYYVTRSYLTRHGAGPLPYEGEIQSFEDITNIPNLHQGTLRFAPLNIDLFKQSVSNDLISEDFLLVPQLVVTWAHLLDLPFVEDDQLHSGNAIDAISRLEDSVPLNKSTLFLTPTAANPCTRNLRSV